MANLPNKQANSLETMRHSCEHVLHQALVELFPGLKRAMGPATEDGFYSDFDYSGKISGRDFPKIEQRMQTIIDKDLPLVRQEVSTDQARQLFSGNEYKLDWLDRIEKSGEKPTVYWTGQPNHKDSDVDLCSGPHVESTGGIGPFKLLSVAGAYWHGDEKNKMLTRIYGSCFPTKQQLDHHLKNLAEAEKTNHRKLGKELELFAIFPEVGGGLPIWLPKGYTIRKTLEDYMYKLERKFGYQHVLTPNIAKDELFNISGHLEFYKDSMFSGIKVEDETYYLKPMNCPYAMLIYRMKPRSYKELPLKFGEFGTVYRYEKSGELQGLQRVRGFTQNDAHIFCTPEQLEQQIIEVVNILKIFYKDLGFKNYWFRLSLSDQKKDKYKFCGSKQEWETAENTFRNVLTSNNIEFKEAVGEAAFYGPKLDIQAVNVFGKEDTISTVQFDFNLPKRFGLSYIDDTGQKKQPYVIHRALIGSFERFFAFLIEYYGGAFPLWLSPIQVQVIPITDRNNEYGQKVLEQLLSSGIRAEIDTRTEKMQGKIRDAQLQKIPYMVVIGDKEQDLGSIAIRSRKDGDLGVMKLEDFLEKLAREAA